MEPLTILDIVINAMERVEFNIKGSDTKKKVALTIIKKSIISTFGEDEYNTYKIMIPCMIEMLILISKNQLIMDINKSIRNKCLKFCNK